MIKRHYYIHFWHFQACSLTTLFSLVFLQVAWIPTRCLEWGPIIRAWVKTLRPASLRSNSRQTTSSSCHKGRAVRQNSWAPKASKFTNNIIYSFIFFPSEKTSRKHSFIYKIYTCTIFSCGFPNYKICSTPSDYSYTCAI